MSRPRAFADQVVARLSPLGPVRARGMFGGFGIYHEDLMFALIASTRLYFKVDDDTVERFEAAGCAPFTYARGEGKRIVMSYREAPAGAIDDPDALLPWAELGLAAARRARARKNKNQRKGRRRSSG